MADDVFTKKIVEKLCGFQKDEDESPNAPGSVCGLKSKSPPWEAGAAKLRRLRRSFSLPERWVEGEAAQEAVARTRGRARPRRSGRHDQPLPPDVEVNVPSWILCSRARRRLACRVLQAEARQQEHLCGANGEVGASSGCE